jgi:hypothetical protein
VRSQARALLLGAQLLWTAGPATSVADPATPHAWIGCFADTIGPDPSLWNTGRGTSLGSAIGQTFLAADTLITRVSVWRPPNIVDVVGAYLFITTVDTAQTPAKPISQGILQDGPTVTVRDSDPPGQLIRVDFLIDPPATLPRPGVYAFFVQREACDPGETRLIANTDDPYPGGFYWVTGRVVSTCALRSVVGGAESTDLIFEMEFCRTEVTVARGATWGQLKLRYR